MKIQLALDTIRLDELVSKVTPLIEYVDILEVGTPLMMLEGMEPVRILKRHFPDKEILCDTKIMDAGAMEARHALDAGADYITVMGVTDNSTIQACVDTAKLYKKKVVADMLCADLKKRIPIIENLDVDYLGVHTGVDQQKNGRTPLEDLVEIKNLTKKSKIAVAGGINADNLQAYLVYSPEILIVGGGIMACKDPVQAAKTIYTLINRNKYEN
ncbi:3-hexulose-6-phosphate synthase [Apibacter sp. HY039]|uniref:3-hexulose-6-phosphate synthase n=1 Tax=Apibacter sp. HY039 TaxID=2501476 RepID=UPI000FEBDDAD|nr:3-hexulose-6-phosphate synthase [Apibacter sp. HY039]